MSDPYPMYTTVPGRSSYEDRKSVSTRERELSNWAMARMKNCRVNCRSSSAVDDVDVVDALAGRGASNATRS